MVLIVFLMSLSLRLASFGIATFLWALEMLTKVVLGHVLSCLFKLSSIQSLLLIRVHFILFAAEIDLVFVDYELREEDSICLLNLTTFVWTWRGHTSSTCT